jgi:hypothetical protein
VLDTAAQGAGGRMEAYERTTTWARKRCARRDRRSSEFREFAEVGGLDELWD